MDDLKLLRDLGEELEHQPPASLVRQRQRLMFARPRRRWANWWAAGLVAVATASAVAVPTLLINGSPTAAPSAESQTVDVSGTRNVLVIGSDTREGAGNAKYGPWLAKSGVGGRSDTIMIIHLPADRGKAIAVSVPRDSMVAIPSCSGKPGRTDMINSAYNSGGAACLRKTLEKLTGLTLQHTVEVDFTGFKGMVDALGGVQVTLPEAVNDRQAKLKLPAGKNTLDGEQALGFARLRHYGDGSDISRIKRQQQLVLAMLKKVKGTMSDPGRLKTFLGEVRKSVKTDMSLELMYELSTELSKTKVNLVTIPVEPYAGEPNRLQWKQPEAGQLFKSLN
ncbi:LCP family protein [Nonomuraea sp. H19]|uniref:LCP family protein n=1 Tax=Nonomuraea sp. H19 TaxID=3452206 RepID=UPI003F89BF00